MQDNHRVRHFGNKRWQYELLIDGVVRSEFHTVLHAALSYQGQQLLRNGSAVIV
jgi:hypothetical protein